MGDGVGATRGADYLECVLCAHLLGHAPGVASAVMGARIQNSCSAIGPVALLGWAGNPTPTPVTRPTRQLGALAVINEKGSWPGGKWKYLFTSLIVMNCGPLH